MTKKQEEAIASAVDHHMRSRVAAEESEGQINQRDRAIRRALKLGVPRAEIAQRVGLSPSRIGQIGGDS